MMWYSMEKNSYLLFAGHLQRNPLDKGMGSTIQRGRKDCLDQVQSALGRNGFGDLSKGRMELQKKNSVVDVVD